MSPPITSDDFLWTYFSVGVPESPHWPSRLEGSIQCLLPPGVYSAPSVLPIEEDETFLSAWAVGHGLLTEGTAGLRKFHGNFGSLAHHLIPQNSDVTPELRQCLGIFLSWTFLHDDILDRLHDRSPSTVDTILSAHQVFCDIIKDKYGRSGDDTALEFPDVDFPSFRQFCVAFRDFHTYLHTHVPFYSVRNDVFVQTFCRYFAAYELSHGETSLASKNVSDESAKFWLRLTTGWRPWIEVILLLRGVTLMADVREDLYFLRLQEACADTIGFINDVLGVGKDLREDERDSLVMYKLREKNLSLSEAFQETLGLVNEQLKDIRLLLKALRQRYPTKDTDGLGRAIEDFIDGYVLWCASCKRYGKLTTYFVGEAS